MLPPSGKKGVRIAENGIIGLLNDGDASTIAVGGDIVLDGGLIGGSASTGSLTFEKIPGANAKVSVIGTDSAIVNEVTFTDMDLDVSITEPNADGDSEFHLAGGAIVNGIANVTLTKGEIAFGDASVLNMTGDFSIADGAGFYADGATATITTSGGTGKTFTLDDGGWVAADNGRMAINDFARATLNGSMAFGAQADGTSSRVVFSDNTDVVIGNDAQFVFYADLTENLNITTPITYANDETVIIQGGQGKIDFTNRSVKNALGQFGVERFTSATAGAGDKVSITSAANNIWAGLSVDQQITQMQNNLQIGLDDNGLGAYATRELATALYGAILAPDGSPYEVKVYPTSTDANPNIAGNNNLLQLDMIAGATQGIHESQLATLLGVNVNNGVLATIGSVNSFGTQITNRLANNRAIFNEASSSDFANASILLNSEYVNRIWAGGLGHWEDGDRRNGIDGYEYDSYGFILGYDRYFGCNLVAGLAFAYTTGDIEAKSAISDDSEVDNYSFQGYVSYNALNGFFASLMGGYTYTDNDNQWSAFENVNGANVATRNSEDYSTDSWNIGGKLGYDWTPVGNFVLTPSVGLNYVHASAEAHNRTSSRDGATWTASRMEKTTVDALLLPVEVAARYDVNFSNCSRLAIEGNVGYSYNFKNDGGDATIIMNGLGQGPNNSPVVLRSIGREQSRHTWNFGAGLRYHYNQFDIGVKYDYYLQSDTDAHRLMGTVGWSF
ncbi:MAG: autotransporter domain-containing protein [Planctomycetes bacterium]|nr:autotransporter domain-containing protein [Planctomycetota bacterium]